MSVLVLGAGGQLGSVLARRFEGDDEVVARTRAELDITDTAAVRAVVAAIRPSLIVNGAAYTRVDEAEREPVRALMTNAIAVRALARAAAEVGAGLVHFSTDFVFDGTGSRPYCEDDAPNPRSVYAASKLLGEWFAAEVPQHYVLRVESLFGGPRRRSSVDKIVDGLVAGEPVRVFVDRTVSPSYVEDVAWATRELVARRAPPGVYHCVNTGVCTWYELAEEAARILGVTPRLVPVRTAEVVLPAPRPQYCALSNAKLASVGIPMPPWQDALARHLAHVSRWGRPT
jgi:dTDP-4-dehydrorhamnose reductase